MGWSGIEGFSWKYLLFIHNLFATGPGFIYVAWSLAVEEWFYLLMPVFFTLLFLALKNKMIAFRMTVMLLFLIPFAARIVYVTAHTSAQSFTPHLGFATLYRLDSIAYGIFFALLWQKNEWRPILLRHKTKLFGLGLTLFAAFLVYMLLFIAKPVQHPVWVLISYPFLTTAITLCFPYMVSMTFGSPNKIKQYITFISLISYSLYLAHPIFIRFFDTLKNEQNPSIMVCLLYFVATITLSILCSYITYVFCERVFLNIRDKWINQSQGDLTISKN
jgi:peptidoglycan/LPS O-acetylase OafA/YrhL